jgi:four helix bundle protein
MRTVMDSRQKRQFDLEERLIDFSCMIIDIVEALPDTKVGNHVAGQILRSGTSPAPNYAEATSAESRQDFIHKMKVSLKEFRETNVWLKVIKRRALIKPLEKMEIALTECRELISIFVTSIATAKRNLRTIPRASSK